MDQQKKYQQWL